MRVIDLGQMNYGEALAVQRERLAEVVADASHEGFLLLVEHVPPVLTLGRRAKAEHILADADTLRRAGIETHEITRGGDVTFHGPGQLVAYPIVRLTPDGRDAGAQRGAGILPACPADVPSAAADVEGDSSCSCDLAHGTHNAGGTPARHAGKMPAPRETPAARRGVHEYVRGLEQAVMDCLAAFGLVSVRRGGATGVWIGDEKIAAIGVAVRRWVTWHGLALNVNVNRKHFDFIVPCGLRDTGITDMTAQLGRPVTLDEVKPVFIDCLRRVLQETHHVGTCDKDSAPYGPAANPPP